MNIYDEINSYIEESESPYIYPGLIQEKYNIEMEEVYKILIYFENRSILDIAFKIYCSRCKKSNGPIYNSLLDLPNDFECEHCGKAINVLRDTIVIFKKRKANER